MAFNGSGVFQRLYSWTNDALAGIKIRADRMDNEMNGMATGLSTCITKDGQTTITANLPMAGFKHTGVGDASAATEYTSFNQVRNNPYYFADTGAADAYVITPSPVFDSYTAGLRFDVKITNANTGTSTLNVNGLGAKAIKKAGSALSANDLVAGKIISVEYNGTDFDLLGGNAGYVTIGGTETLTNKTLTSPKINQILDSNGNEELIFTTTASAVNEMTVANAATGNNPALSATGGDTNIGVDIQPKGTGVVNVKGTASTSAEVRLFEDTDNGTNYAGIKAAASTTSSYTMTLPAALPASKKGMQIDSSGNVTFDGSGLIVQKTSNSTSSATTGAGTYAKGSVALTTAGGNEVITVSITPTNASNILEISAICWVDSSAVDTVQGGIFQDSTVNALCPASMNSNGGAVAPLIAFHRMTAGTTSATTFKIRAGGSSGTLYINQDSAGNTLGGLTSYITVTEYTP